MTLCVIGARGLGDTPRPDVHSQPAQVQGEGEGPRFPRSTTGQRRAQPCFRTIPAPAGEEREGPRASGAGGLPRKLEGRVKRDGPNSSLRARVSSPLSEE